MHEKTYQSCIGFSIFQCEQICYERKYLWMNYLKKGGGELCQRKYFYVESSEHWMKGNLPQRTNFFRGMNNAGGQTPSPLWFHSWVRYVQILSFTPHFQINRTRSESIFRSNLMEISHFSEVDLPLLVKKHKNPEVWIDLHWALTCFTFHTSPPLTYKMDENTGAERIARANYKNFVSWLKYHTFTCTLALTYKKITKING